MRTRSISKGILVSAVAGLYLFGAGNVRAEENTPGQCLRLDGPIRFSLRNAYIDHVNLIAGKIPHGTEHVGETALNAGSFQAGAEGVELLGSSFDASTRLRVVSTDCRTLPCMANLEGEIVLSEQLLMELAISAGADSSSSYPGSGYPHSHDSSYPRSPYPSVEIGNRPVSSSCVVGIAVDLNHSPLTRQVYGQVYLYLDTGGGVILQARHEVDADRTERQDAIAIAPGSTEASSERAI